MRRSLVHRVQFYVSRSTVHYNQPRTHHPSRSTHHRRGRIRTNLKAFCRDRSFCIVAFPANDEFNIFTLEQNSTHHEVFKGRSSHRFLRDCTWLLCARTKVSRVKNSIVANKFERPTTSTDTTRMSIFTVCHLTSTRQ